MLTTWTIAAAAMLTLQGAASEPVNPQVLEPISIPQELAPALMPYLSCRQSQQGVALIGKEGEVLNDEDEGEDCSELRTKARGKTVGILKGLMLYRNRDERQQVADYWLKKIDDLTPPLES